MEQIPMISSYVCASCQHVFADNVPALWGIKYGVGLGPVVVCDQLIHDQVTGSGSNCRGMLAAVITAGAPALEVASPESQAEEGEDLPL